MPYFTYPISQVTPDIEFLAYEHGKRTISHSIVNDGLEPDKNGQIWAIKGSFIDKDGKVIKPTYGEDSITFSSDPIGILFATVNVTHGAAHGAILTHGTIKADMFNWGEYDYKPELAKSVKEKLPEIDFIDNSGGLVYGSNGSAPSEIKGVEPGE